MPNRFRDPSAIDDRRIAYHVGALKRLTTVRPERTPRKEPAHPEEVGYAGAWEAWSLEFDGHTHHFVGESFYEVEIVARETFECEIETAVDEGNEVTFVWARCPESEIISIDFHQGCGDVPDWMDMYRDVHPDDDGREPRSWQTEARACDYAWSAECWYTGKDAREPARAVALCSTLWGDLCPF